MLFNNCCERFDGVFVGRNLVIVPSDIVTAFSDEAIGSKILCDELKFLEEVAKGIESFDWSSCRIPGQAYLKLSKYACNFVGAGVGKRTKDPKDYVIRVHRGEVGLYLHRSLAAKNVDDVAVVIYTLDAYLKNPDITEDEVIRISDINPTHVIVAILASSGEPSVLSPGRFVSNLSGGNREALVWTADEIRDKAKAIKQFNSEWCVVAD